MSRKSLLNQLELAHAPLTAYEFAVVKDDRELEMALDKANLYVIGQRPVITFENLIFDPIAYTLNFEIRQKGNTEVLNCKLPLIQTVVGSVDGDTITVAFHFIEKSIYEQNQPFNGLRGFSFAQKIGNEARFLIWFSPEKLIRNWCNGDIECEIKGNVRSFSRYKVHYVGKATKQNILRRLTGALNTSRYSFFGGTSN